MKILIINGSPRVNGATGNILSSIEKNLSEMDSNIRIERVNLGETDLQFCKGCALCYQTGKCHIEDALERLSGKIAQSDGVVFGSPTYASNVSGQFKTMIDRGHFVFEQLLKNKACFSVVTYENYGGQKAQRVITGLIMLSGGAVSCRYMVKLCHGEQALNGKRNKRITKLCRKFIRQAQQRNPLSFYERIFGAISFQFGIKPHAFKNAPRYGGVINRWAKLKLIPEKG